MSVLLSQLNYFQDAMPELTQQEIEDLTEEDYAMFLAYGVTNPYEIKEEHYESYLKSQRKFDL